MRRNTAILSDHYTATPTLFPTAYVDPVLILGRARKSPATPIQSSLRTTKILVWKQSLTRLAFRLSHLTVLMLCLLLGIRLFVFGNWLQALPLDASSATPTMFCPSPSPPTTVRSSRGLATALSSSGTRSVTASTPFPKRDTLNGFRASGSAPTPKTP